MACDPIFNTLTPIARTNFNQDGELTGIDWGIQQKIYLDAQNAPLAYGKKTYFYGETYSGSLEIKLDYQSSALFPGLIKEVNIENKTLKRLYISGGQNYPELSGIYDHVLDMNSKPYSTFWKHSQKNVILGKILIEENGDDKWEKCILVAWTGQSNTSELEAGNGAIFTNHYWQGRTGAGADGKKFDRHCLPDRLNFTNGVIIYPQYNITNFNINSNRFLEIKSGNANAQIITNDLAFKYRLGVENISAFEVDIYGLGLGTPGADITILHDKNKIGQLHRFLKVGGIYYQDLDSIYGQRYNKLGALSLSNGSPIWNLTGKPSIEMREAFEIMWYGSSQEDKFLPKLVLDPSIIDDNHPKYQKPLFNYSPDFVKFQPDKIFGKNCEDGISSCTMSLNWASSSSLSRTADTDQNFNNPNLDEPSPPSIFEPIAPSPDFKLPDEMDIINEAGQQSDSPFTAAPEPDADPECPWPTVCQNPPEDPGPLGANFRIMNVLNPMTEHGESSSISSSISSSSTCLGGWPKCDCPPGFTCGCAASQVEMIQTMCACRLRAFAGQGSVPPVPADPSSGPAGAKIEILNIVNKKISSPTTTSNSSKS